MRFWSLICAFALLTIGASSCTQPPPTAVYLSLDGIGSAEETNLYYQSMKDHLPEPTLDQWKASRCFPPDKFPEDLGDSSGQIKAFYYNPSDLGLGREMRCAQCPDEKSKLGLISCAVSNHGPLDGPTLGIALANRLKKPDALNSQNPAGQHAELRRAIIRESLQIVEDFLNQPPGTRTKFRRQTVAMDFDRNRPNPDDRVRFYIYDAEDPKFLIPPNTVPGALIPGLALDNEGIKFMRNCTYCHGGTFDPTTNQIRGSSFLDFNLAYLDYGDSPELLTPAELHNGGIAPTTQFKKNQVSLNKLNDLVKTTIENAGLAFTIRDRIQGGNYTVKLAEPSGVATTFLPAAWAGHEDLFTKVVRPYCATCHFSQSAHFNLRRLSGSIDSTPLDFSTAAQWFRPDIQLQIQKSVCGSGDMPHAEVTRLNLLADPVAFGLICGTPDSFSH